MATRSSGFVEHAGGAARQRNTKGRMGSIFRNGMLQIGAAGVVPVVDGPANREASAHSPRFHRRRPGSA